MTLREEYNSAEQFMMDEAFRDWVLDPKPDKDAFWETWIKSNPGQEKNVLLAKELVRKMEFTQKPVNQERHDRVLENILSGQLSDYANSSWWQPTTFNYKRWLKIAAVFLLAGFLYALTDLHYSKRSLKKETIVTKRNPKGRKSQIFLPDGSIVWLNAESRIQYPAVFFK